MQEVNLTCPLTGVSFSAVKDKFGNIYARNPLTGVDVRLSYNAQADAYIISSLSFQNIETVTFSKAAEILGVSRQRINAIAAKNVITPHEVNGAPVFLLSDVIEYGKTRKIGAPKKCEV